jgi:hypothetical protein
MTTNMHVGDIIWDSSEDGRVQIGVGQCKDPSLVLIYGVTGVENCIVGTIISMVEAFEERRFFCPTPTAQYCGSLVGNDRFWLVRDVFHVGRKTCISIGGRHSRRRF